MCLLALVYYLWHGFDGRRISACVNYERDSMVGDVY